MEIKSNSIIFHLEENKVNGIIGNKIKEYEEILTLNKDQIIINKKEIKGKEKYELKRIVEKVEEFFELDNNYSSVYEWLWNQINNKNIYPKDINKKIVDAIKIVGLEEKILDLSFMEISSSEKKLLQIASSLLTNPKIILLFEPFKLLDLKSRKKLYSLLQKLSEKYKKIIVIFSSDVESLYQYSNNLVITKNNKVIIEGETTKVFKEVELLKKNKIDIPEIIEFTYLTRNLKNVKIDYFKDVRDIIKDIYKHVGRNK